MRRGRFLACLALALLLRGARTQQQCPFSGQNTPPSTSTETPITIVASILLDRLIGLEPRRNTYSAWWWVKLSWQDDRVAAQIRTDTAAWLANGTCAFPCDASSTPQSGCCASMWLPQVEMPNLISQSQDRVTRYRVGVDPKDGSVYMMQRLYGDWFSPMDFRTYPFDHQHLLVELMLGTQMATNVQLVWGKHGIVSNSPHHLGEAIAGWTINWIKTKVYDSRPCTPHNASTYVAAVPSPMMEGVDTYNLDFTTIDPVQFNYTQTERGGAVMVYDDACDASTPDQFVAYGPVVLTLSLMIRRARFPMTLACVVPIILVDIIAFVTFFIAREALEVRIGIIITLLLSLTTLNFSMDVPYSTSLNCLQQLLVLSYFLMFLLCCETLFAYYVSRIHRRNAEAKARAEAVARYLTAKREAVRDAKERRNSACMNYGSRRTSLHMTYSKISTMLSNIDVSDLPQPLNVVTRPRPPKSQRDRSLDRSLDRALDRSLDRDAGVDRESGPPVSSFRERINESMSLETVNELSFAVENILKAGEQNVAGMMKGPDQGLNGMLKANASNGNLASAGNSGVQDPDASSASERESLYARHFNASSRSGHDRLAADPEVQYGPLGMSRLRTPKYTSPEVVLEVEASNREMDGEKDNMQSPPNLDEGYASYRLGCESKGSKQLNSQAQLDLNLESEPGCCWRVALPVHTFFQAIKKDPDYAAHIWDVVEFWFSISLFVGFVISFITITVLSALKADHVINSGYQLLL